jgi:hypothetical protein
MGATKNAKPNLPTGNVKDGVNNREESNRAKVTAGVPAAKYAKYDAHTLLLAAVAYGEASDQDVFEEMAAIANVIVRQSKARGASLGTLLGPGSTFAFAASDGNRRAAAFRKASGAQRAKHPGMVSALKAATNAISGGKDYSNGAYFWDGADLASNYDDHPKVKKGIKFTDATHNIYNVKETSVDVTTHWQINQGGKLVDGKKRGSYTYTYESTAAYGGTVFWKYGKDFLDATGNKPYR